MVRHMVGSFLLGREWKEDSKARLVIYNNTGHSIRTACWLVAVWHTKEVTWTQRCYDTSRRGRKKKPFVAAPPGMRNLHLLWQTVHHHHHIQVPALLYYCDRSGWGVVDSIPTIIR